MHIYAEIFSLFEMHYHSIDTTGKLHTWRDFIHSIKILSSGTSPGSVNRNFQNSVNHYHVASLFCFVLIMTTNRIQNAQNIPQNSQLNNPSKIAYQILKD